MNEAMESSEHCFPNEVEEIRKVAKLKDRFGDVREYSLKLARELSPEDQQVQSMSDVSPTKWRLAHTTWFFETVLLTRHARGFVLFDERYPFPFNSYYEALGPRQARAQRGLATRPSIEEVRAYRRYVDDAVLELLDSADDGLLTQIEPVLTLGLHHEQQHQELILTDILHAFSCNPLLPAYRQMEAASPPVQSEIEPIRWLRQQGGIVKIGHQGPGFSFDNERPHHDVLLRPYDIAHRLVTCGGYAAFIADGGTNVRSFGSRMDGQWSSENDSLRPHTGAGKDCA
jgi:ergothioneine biosynthesis protein EgtB